jgi:hypothetical protein
MYSGLKSSGSVATDRLVRAEVIHLARARKRDPGILRPKLKGLSYSPSMNCIAYRGD